MILQPKEILTQTEVSDGLKTVIWEGMTTEAMVTLASSTFMVAFAVLLGASNFQIGLLASLPTFTNIFQLLSVWLTRKYNNRRALSVICSILARVPMVPVRYASVYFWATGTG